MREQRFYSAACTRGLTIIRIIVIHLVNCEKKGHAYHLLYIPWHKSQIHEKDYSNYVRLSSVWNQVYENVGLMLDIRMDKITYTHTHEDSESWKRKKLLKRSFNWRKSRFNTYFQCAFWMTFTYSGSLFESERIATQMLNKMLTSSYSFLHSAHAFF